MWADERDRRGDTSEAARYVSSEVIGYEDLDGHGEWLDASEYGHVWRPRYLVYDWAPYRFGRWGWVSPLGLDLDGRRAVGLCALSLRALGESAQSLVLGARAARTCDPSMRRRSSAGQAIRPAVFRGRLAASGGSRSRRMKCMCRATSHTPRHARRVNQANTVIDDANITRAYTTRDPVRDYRHRADSNSVTVGQLPNRESDRGELDAPRAVGQVSVPRATEESSAPRAAGAANRPAPATTSRPPASYSPAASSPHGSAASAPQSSRREAGDAPPRRSSQPQPRDASRPTYQQP